MQIVPRLPGDIRERTDYYSVPYSGAPYSVARYVDTARQLYNVASKGYGLYKKAIQNKRAQNTPFLRGPKKPRVSTAPKAISSVPTMTSGYTASSGSRWRKSFRSKGLSRSSRRRFRRRFIGCRNKREYLSQWGFNVGALPTPKPNVGEEYRYAVLDIIVKDIVQSLIVLDDATSPNAIGIFDRGQKIFMSKYKKDVYIKNPYSVGLNYRILWTQTEVTDAATRNSLQAIEPWCPIFHRDEWKNRDERFLRQEVGYLSADEDVTLHFFGVPGFIKMTSTDTRAVTYRLHVWTWSELQIQKGSTYIAQTTAGYIDVNPQYFFRDGFSFIVDQGLNLNDNIKHGYSNLTLVAITNPLVKTEDKMVLDNDVTPT